jgi:DNA-binding transcriptional regulator/RsmH inhibitor MraZ
MAFSGVKQHRLDGKDRLVIPSAWAAEIRDTSGGRVALVQSHSTPCLLVMPERYYDELAKRYAPDPLKGATLEERLMFHGAEHLELKGPGRITLPKRFLPLFPSRAVALCGTSTYIEVWDQDVYQEAVGSKATTYTLPAPKSKGG